MCVCFYVCKCTRLSSTIFSYLIVCVCTRAQQQFVVAAMYICVGVWLLACVFSLNCMPAHIQTHTYTQNIGIWRLVNLFLHFICLHVCVCICKCLSYLLAIYLFGFLLLPSSLSLLSYTLNLIALHLFNNSISPFAVAIVCLPRLACDCQCRSVLPH